MTLSREQVIGDIRECVQMKALEPDLSVPQDPNEYIKQLRQRLLDLEQALRLHLAVGPDDPLVVEPVEQEVVRLRQRCEHHQWKQEQNEQEVDRLRQQLATVTQENDLLRSIIQQDIPKSVELKACLEAYHHREELHGELSKLVRLKERAEHAEQQLTSAQADIATRDRTIAAMAAKAMSLVPGSKDVDEAWATLAKRKDTP